MCENTPSGAAPPTGRAMPAQRVWRRMKETNLHECRSGHAAETMNTELQSEGARARHAQGKAGGQTCIACHYGIAHKEPGGPRPRGLKVGASD
jgi:cytochrome c-type protein NapC